MEWLTNQMAIKGVSLTGIGVSISTFIDSIPNQIPAAIIGISTLVLTWVMIWKNISSTIRNNKLKDQEIERGKIEIKQMAEACKACHEKKELINE